MESVKTPEDIGTRKNEPDCPVSDDSEGGNTAASTNSSVPSENDAKVKSVPPQNIVDNESKRYRTLKERAKVPPGMLVSVLIVASLLYSSGFIANFATDIVPGLYESLTFVVTDIQQSILSNFPFSKLQDTSSLSENLSAYKILATSIVVAVLGSIFNVLLIKPFRAGMWTGTRARRHRIHRYMGLLYLLQYAAAWYEFIANYEGSGKKSYLPVTIALNGKSACLNLNLEFMYFWWACALIVASCLSTLLFSSFVICTQESSSRRLLTFPLRSCQI